MNHMPWTPNEKTKPRKYALGTNPCANCMSGRYHSRCRPRLDNTLCSCSCEYAEHFRDLASDLVGMTDEDKALWVAPISRPSNFADETIPAIPGRELVGKKRDQNYFRWKHLYAHKDHFRDAMAKFKEREPDGDASDFLNALLLHYATHS